MRKRSKSAVDYSWLDQFDTDGPFLSLPVVKSVWPNGVDRLGDTDDRAVTFKQAYADWLRAYDARMPDTREEYAETTRAWIDTVLGQLADWEGLHVGEADLPAEIEIRSPGEQIRIRPDGALEGRDTDFAALLRIVESSDDLRGPNLDGWSATEIDRMAALLRKANVQVGIVTDGRWWAIVWAHRDKPTGSAVTDAATWGEEDLVRDAFLALISQRRFRAKDIDERLPKFLERSELEAEEITKALGTQVRKAVELLVGSFSRHRLEALAVGDPEPLPEKEDDVYQAAVTVMMRVVFLLFAEERGMLPTEQLYWGSYAIRDVLDDLHKRASHGEELLDETYDTWHRLLAVSDALHRGVNYDEMRMPAYGGSLLDSDRFPWLSATDGAGLRIKVPDRVMLHVLKSVQYANIGKEARRISFRDIDVEQIGYIYEGLLGYTCATVESGVVIGLNGKDGEEPEIDVSTLQELYDDNNDGKSFAKALHGWVKSEQPSTTPATLTKIAKAYDAEITDEQRAEAIRQLSPIARHDKELLAFLVARSALIRRDLRGIPFVVPIGGLVVIETPSRKHAGAHYTPRSLAEGVVERALKPLVYEPGPLQENDRDKWQLKDSTEILNLKVADIAAGSGAFLVAAARFLAKHVVDAWTAEEAITAEEKAHPDRAYERAIREVIARCLYGADINPMAVEMCKLSLWLVSLDPTKPFSFVDDKIFCGNSLLGVTSIEQLRRLHIYPERADANLITELVGVDAKLAEATRLRRELASPIVEHDPMRSSAGKKRLLLQAKKVTAELRDVGDGVIAAGLAHGGKPSRRLDGAYKALSWALGEAYPSDGSDGDRAKLDAILEQGLTPTVDTDYERWQAIHWVIEAPDVMLDHGGFDSLIGNPPFLRISQQTSAMGENLRELVVMSVADGARGMADFVAYFFRRAAQIANENACIGFVATNSISQNDSSRVGLVPLLQDGWRIFNATKSAPWPALANFHYSEVSLARRASATVQLNGRQVGGISNLLDEVRELGDAVALRENRDLSFEGFKLTGRGFILEPEEASELLSKEPASGTVIHPYLVTDDLTSSAGEVPSRYAIDFGSLSLEDVSERHPVALERIRETVKPQRDTAKRKAVRERWWQYGENRPGLRAAIANLDSVIVVGALAKWLTVSRQPVGTVFSNRVFVLAFESHGAFAALNSSLHESWVRTYSGALEDRLAYSSTSSFITFPRMEPSEQMHEVGATLDRERRQIMMRRELGLTALYNLVNDPQVQGDANVDRMREIHVEVDEATMAAYDWDDLPLDHGFHTYRQMERWTVSPEARVEILDRLLELNHERARAEGKGVPDQAELF